MMTQQVRVIVGLTLALAVSLCANAFMGGVILSERHLFSHEDEHEEEREHEEARGPAPLPGAIAPGSIGQGERGSREQMFARGEVSRGEHGGRMRGAMRDFAEAVPPEVRAPLMEAMRAQRPQIEEKMQGVQQARQASVAALRAETFDLDALKTALAAQRSAQSEVQATVHEGLLKAIAAMTPEQRAQLGDGAERLFK